MVGKMACRNDPNCPLVRLEAVAEKLAAEALARIEQACWKGATGLERFTLLEEAHSLLCQVAVCTAGVEYALQQLREALHRDG